MQKTILFLALIFSVSISAQEVQLTWQKDFNLAIEMAKSENKPVLIYFTKNDCEPCQKFYNDFFKQDAFTKISDDFVLLMLDGSNQDIKTTDMAIIKQRRMAMHYNKVSIYPAVLAVDKERMELGEILITGDQNAIENYWTFLEALK